MKVKIRIHPDGRVTAIHRGVLSPVLERMGTTLTRRASRVVPVNWFLRVAFKSLRWLVADDSRLAQWTRGWRVRWLADLSLSDGPTLGPFEKRELAIVAEIEWLESNGKA